MENPSPLTIPLPFYVHIFYAYILLVVASQNRKIHNFALNSGPVSSFQANLPLTLTIL